MTTAVGTDMDSDLQDDFGTFYNTDQIESVNVLN